MTPIALASTPSSDREFAPDIVEDSHLITEDDTPVDNLYTALQMPLLVDALKASWSPGRKYYAAANVGMFFTNRNPAIVPDVFLSMDIEENPGDAKAQRSYLVWERGKSPELVIEIVSNDRGGELDHKLRTYAEPFRVPHYVVWDPFGHLGEERLHVFRLTDRGYEPTTSRTFPDLGLGVTLQESPEGLPGLAWLRFTDLEGRVLLTGRERATAAEEKLAAAQAKLRELGIDPASVGL